MRKLTLTLAAIALSAGVLAMSKADAMPLGSALGNAADSLNVVEQTQFVWGGRNYCWYPDGWRGPGWYWCGYQLRRGLGWGGPLGWHGWRHGGPRVHRGGGPRMHGGPGPRMRGGPGPGRHGGGRRR
jgi:hypothetical protein